MMKLEKLLVLVGVSIDITEYKKKFRRKNISSKLTEQISQKLQIKL